MKIPIVKQHDFTDCGPACLQSIMLFYGGYNTIEAIRIDANTTIQGTYADKMIEAAHKYGFVGECVELDDIKKIKTLKLPVIAHVKYENGLYHYICIYKVTDKYMIVMDPGKGKYKINYEDFSKISTLIFITLYPYKKIIAFSKPTSTFKMMLNIMHNHKLLVIKILAFSSCAIILTIISGMYYKYLSIYQSKYLSLKIIIVFFGLIYIIKSIISFIKDKLVINLSIKVYENLMYEFIDHFFSIPLNFIKSKTSGEISTRFYELNEVNSFLISIILTGIIDLIVVLISGVFLINISFNLFRICFICSLAYLIISFVQKNPTLQMISENKNNDAKLNTDIIDTSNALVSIKYINNESNIKKRLKRRSQKYLDGIYKYNKYLVKANFIRQLISDLSVYLIYTTGFLGVLNKNISIVDFIIFITIMPYFMETIKEISDEIVKFYYLKSSVIKLNEFNLITKKCDGSFNFKNGSIDVKNLNFAYNDLDNILNNFSCHINEGEKVLIKGPSGCGKSTFCQILSKQLTVNKACIKIADTLIQDINDESYRKNIVYIGQKDNLINDTIYNNIKFERNVDEDKIKTICRLCEIEKIVNGKYERFNTLVEENAQNLSGGERQRIILARGLLKDSSIIILDEALSEVNKELEIKILKNIFRYYQNKTLIYVSHKNYPNIFNKVIYM